MSEKDFKSGVTLSDILLMPACYRKIMTFLVKNPGSSIPGIINALGIKEDEPGKYIREMLKKGMIKQILQDRRISYCANLADNLRTHKAFLPPSLWESYEISDYDFFKKNRLFRGLSTENISKTIDISKKRIYRLNEILLWQEDTPENLCLIKNGISAACIIKPELEKNRIVQYFHKGDLIGGYALSCYDSTMPYSVIAYSRLEIFEIPVDYIRELISRHPAFADCMLSSAIDESRKLVISGEKKAKIIVFLRFNSDGKDAEFKILSKYSEMTEKKICFIINDPEREKTCGTNAEGKEGERFSEFFDIKYKKGEDFFRDEYLYQDVISRYSLICIQHTVDKDRLENMDFSKADKLCVILDGKKPSLTDVEKILRRNTHKAKTGMVFKILEPEDNTGKEEDDDRYDIIISQNEEIREKDLLRFMSFMDKDCCICIYIPTTINRDESFDTSEIRDQLKKYMTCLFGGVTVLEADGTYKSGQNIIVERVYIIKSFMKDDLMDLHLYDVLDYIDNLKRKLNQEAIAVEVNERVMFI